VNTGAREAVLQRIRAASPGPASSVVVPRDYRGPSGPGDAELFVERLRDYHAGVQRVALDDVGTMIGECLERRGVVHVGVASGFPTPWLGDVAGRVTFEESLTSTGDLESLDGVLTQCRLGIAETGTIVLTHRSGQGRRALTLVPDYHLVVVQESQVLRGVPDAVSVLAGEPVLTWISGPSATSDIELKRVEGVHGPRTLEVVLVR
jgi:L-lactate dehydrogenase complex protein LldG